MENQKKIKGYTINFQKKLGEGSYGKVFIGEDDRTHEKVAIKIMTREVIDNDEYLRNAIFSEIDILKTLKSPNIVQFKCVVQSDHYYYIIQELCDGGDLGHLIQKKGPFSETEAIKYLTQMVSGFIELISEGVIHRDLKPNNVFMSQGVLKIADFGFSKKMHNKRVKNASMVGTPLYMSIEILKGIPYTSKCDIWALGLIFYQLLFKVTPWDANTEYQLIYNIQHKPLNFPRKLSPATYDFIKRCLGIEQKNRFSWDQLLRHEIFNGYFNGYIQSKVQLENKLKGIMNKIRFDLTKRNINIEKIFLSLGFQKNHQLNFEQFTQFMKTTGNTNLTKQQLLFFFEKIDVNDSDTISYGQILNIMEKNNISTNAVFHPQIVRSPSINQDSFNKIEQFNKRILQAFLNILNQIESKQILLETIFYSFRHHNAAYLKFDQFTDLLNSFGKFEKSECQLIYRKVDSSYRGIPNLVEYDQFYDYFCRVVGRPPRIFIVPKNQFNPISLGVEHILPVNNIKQESTYNGISIRYNKELGVFTEVYDEKIHQGPQQKGFLGLFKG